MLDDKYSSFDSHCLNTAYVRVNYGMRVNVICNNLAWNNKKNNLEHLDSILLGRSENIYYHNDHFYSFVQLWIHSYGKLFLYLNIKEFL
jgi:hypothetical protein